MRNPLMRHLTQLDKKESRIVHRSSDYIGELTAKLDDKIPPKLRKTLHIAFHKAFKFVFDNGTGVIEKTISTDKIKSNYAINEAQLSAEKSKRNLKEMDKQANSSKWLNSVLTTSEGAVLGLFGIGLPDIPIFVGMILKGIYETALSYGFKYDTDEERCYILTIIACAMSHGDEKFRLNAKAESIEYQLRHEKAFTYIVGTEIENTANLLADEMLTSKFIQGLPIVGVIGSVTNLVAYRKIMNYAGVKYKKRFLHTNLR